MVRSALSRLAVDLLSKPLRCSLGSFPLHPCLAQPGASEGTESAALLGTSSCLDDHYRALGGGGLPLIRETDFLKGVKRSEIWALRPVLQKQVRAVWLFSEALFLPETAQRGGCGGCCNPSLQQLLPLLWVIQGFSLQYPGGAT